MKTVNILITILLLAAGARNIYAAEPPAAKTVVSQEVIELNLLNGVESGNDGLQLSSAYFLGEMKSAKSVIPLMKLLHESKDESVRIMAALSLIKIGDSRGVYAVQQQGRFDESDHVRTMCRHFYAAYTTGRSNPQ